MKNLNGKTALVTGASRGIGRRIAVGLARRGMNLVVSARSSEALEETIAAVQRHNVNVVALPADLRGRDEVAALAERAEAESGGISVLVNNAAIERALQFELVEPSAIAEMIEVNLTAPMTLTRLLLPKMLERGEGHIVNMSSLAGMVATPYDDTYAATKHGLVGFSRSLRLTLRSEGHPIGVSVICPAFVEEDGMYHSASGTTGAVAPVMLGTVTMQKVTSAVIRAIVRDEAEVVLTGKPVLPFLLTQTISPRLAGRMSAMVGVPNMFRKWAAAEVKPRA